MFAVERLHFNGHSLFGFEVESKMYFTERARINFVIELEPTGDYHFMIDIVLKFKFYKIAVIKGQSK